MLELDRCYICHVPFAVHRARGTFQIQAAGMIVTTEFCYSCAEQVDKSIGILRSTQEQEAQAKAEEESKPREPVFADYTEPDPYTRQKPSKWSDVADIHIRHHGPIPGVESCPIPWCAKTYAAYQQYYKDKEEFSKGRATVGV